MWQYIQFYHILAGFSLALEYILSWVVLSLEQKKYMFICFIKKNYPRKNVYIKQIQYLLLYDLIK